MAAPVILVNTITNDCGRRDAVEQAVLHVLERRSGDWFASLLETRDDDQCWRVMVGGPEGLRQSWTFTPAEQEPAMVQATLERDLQGVSLPMRWQTITA